MDEEVGQISYAYQDLGGEGRIATGADRWASLEESLKTTNDEPRLVPLDVAQTSFREFFRGFLEKGVYPYRNQLLKRYNRGERHVVVQARHLAAYDEGLLESLQRCPVTYHPLFEAGVRDALRHAIALGEKLDEEKVYSSNIASSGAGGGDHDEKSLLLEEGGGDFSHVPKIQVVLHSDQTPIPMRSLESTDIHRLVLISGIIVSASRVRPRATTVCVRCRECNTTKTIVLDGSDGVPPPKRCWEASCKGKRDSLVLVPDRGTYVDTQTLKLQEAPEAVPTGEMPRSVVLMVDRELVDQVSPGARVSVTGVLSVYGSSSSSSSMSGGQSRGGGGGVIRVPYVHVLGIQITSVGGAAGRGLVMTTAEEEECLYISRRPELYQCIANSVAPSISGAYTEDIKRAIACLLFGGSRKRLPDGVRLRGDINILLLGDPSTAKSQFLKFVEKVAPVGVYTSGKGSSAAGLTASVVRDSLGEFYLEGGAMVLADGGVVCIDEFDKMREQDRVAIHEAMEQQTISIAKAGITTVLNSRTSVLAAANPVFGTYNDSKTAAENIDFLPTILSRFDMIFIVRDVRDEEKDKMIARHVLGIHVGYTDARSNNNTAVGSTSSAAASVAAMLDSSSSTTNSVVSSSTSNRTNELDLLALKRYVSFCRARCAPVLSPQAADMLRNHYVGIREEHRQQRATKNGSSSASAVPITVRQLEALVRISESLAKMQLASVVDTHHVSEALRLFKVSTLNAAQRGSLVGDISSLGQDQVREINRIEEQLLRRVPIGTVVPTQRLLEELVNKQGFSVFGVHKTFYVMVARGDFAHLNSQRTMKRLR